MMPLWRRYCAKIFVVTALRFENDVVVHEYRRITVMALRKFVPGASNPSGFCSLLAAGCCPSVRGSRLLSATSWRLDAAPFVRGSRLLSAASWRLDAAPLFAAPGCCLLPLGGWMLPLCSRLCCLLAAVCYPSSRLSAGVCCLLITPRDLTPLTSVASQMLRPSGSLRHLGLGCDGARLLN